MDCFIIFYPFNWSIIEDSRRKNYILTGFNIDMIKIKYYLVFLCFGSFIKWTTFFPCCYYIKCGCPYKVFLFFMISSVYVWSVFMVLYPYIWATIWDSKRKHNISTEFNIEIIKIKYFLVCLCIGTFINWTNLFPLLLYDTMHICADILMDILGYEFLLLY